VADPDPTMITGTVADYTRINEPMWGKKHEEMMLTVCKLPMDCVANDWDWRLDGVS